MGFFSLTPKKIRVEKIICARALAPTRMGSTKMDLAITSRARE
jgi:hypothetical protein